jgi:deoxyribodipyrimidine photolyase-related protein
MNTLTMPSETVERPDSTVLSQIQTVLLVLGDQLNENHSLFGQPSTTRLIVLMEVASEQTYVLQHRAKSVLFFKAMRLFARQLQHQKHLVWYIRLTDPDNTQIFEGNIRQLLAACPQVNRLEYIEPDEWRLDRQFADWSTRLGVSVVCHTAEHFLTSRTDLAELMGNRKHWLMEHFYRTMRRRYGLLLDDTGQPTGGKWNFDQENRAKPPKGHCFPTIPTFQTDFSAEIETLASARLPGFGSYDGLKYVPVTRGQALEALEDFATHRLAHFGLYQDTMISDEPFGYHSLLSFPLNVKLLHPLEVVNRCIEEWHRHPDRISIAQVEGFVRQIIGWREYIRGIYWAKMPDYAETNTFNAQAPLPDWYWTAETRMNCLHQCIRGSLRHGYAHHIQRLMITGNFATLTGTRPSDINAWYLGIYIDALEWVQLPNTHGMSQFADNGLIATKPYVSAGAYIQRMSDYCTGCAYNVKKRHGPDACPFNSLYWYFLSIHERHLSANPRMAQMYATLRKFGPAEREAILTQAQQYLERINTL